MTTTLAAEVGTFSLTGFDVTLGLVGLRQQIIDKLDMLLKLIRIASGYYTDLGANVFSWRDTEKNPLAATELSGMVYRDQLSSRSVGAGVYDQTLRIDYEIYADSIATIRKALADVERALIADETLTGLVDGSDMGAGEDIVVEHLEEKLFRLKDFIEIYFQTVRGDPTTKA